MCNSGFFRFSMGKFETPGWREHWRHFKTWGPQGILMFGTIFYLTFKYIDRYEAEQQSSFRDKTALYGRPPEQRTHIPWPRQSRDETLPPNELSLT